MVGGGAAEKRAGYPGVGVAQSVSFEGSRTAASLQAVTGSAAVSQVGSSAWC